MSAEHVRGPLLLKIHKQCATTVLAQLYVGNSTKIRITERNSDAYEAWCRRMSDISGAPFGASFRAVDIERGLFHLIQCGNVDIATQIVKEA